MREIHDELLLSAVDQLDRGLCCGLPAARLPSGLDARGSLQNVLCDQAPAQRVLPDDATVQATYTAMSRSLNLLLENDGMRALTRKLINEEPIGGWTEDELCGFPEWSDARTSALRSAATCPSIATAHTHTGSTAEAVRMKSGRRLLDRELDRQTDRPDRRESFVVGSGCRMNRLENVFP